MPYNMRWHWVQVRAVMNWGRSVKWSLHNSPKAILSSLPWFSNFLTKFLGSRQILSKHSRSSHRSCSIEKAVLKNFAIFTRKIPMLEFLLNKVAGLRRAAASGISEVHLGSCETSICGGAFLWKIVSYFCVKFHHQFASTNSLTFDLYYDSCTLYICTLDIFSCDNMFAETCPKISLLKFLDTVYSSSFF